MSASKDRNRGVIFTCHEARAGLRWKFVCLAWGEVVETGMAKTQAEARQKNREAKARYLASLKAAEIPCGVHAEIAIRA